MRILVQLGTNIEDQNLIDDDSDIIIRFELSDEIELSESEKNNIQKGNEEYRNVLKKIYYRLEDALKDSFEIVDHVLEMMKISGEIGALENKIPREQLDELISRIEMSQQNTEVAVHVYDVIFNNVNFKEDVYNLLKENHEMYSEVKMIQ